MLSNHINDSGNIVYYYYNNNQAQLWVDGCNFYRYRIPTSYEIFWEFESIDFIQCNSFVTKFSRDEYEHEIIEQTTLLLMWIVLHRIDCKSTYLFKKKYLLLTKDQISLFINWIVYLRDQFSCVGIEALKVVYNKSISKTCDIQISPVLSPLHDNIALSPVDEDLKMRIPSNVIILLFPILLVIELPSYLMNFL